MDTRDFLDETALLEQIEKQAYTAVKELVTAGKLTEGDLLVVGCSTSEVGGGKIGTSSSPKLAEMVFGGIAKAAGEHGIFLAAQCCEHLNRALIMEKEAARIRGYEQVNVVPMPKAGGSFATRVYNCFKAPVAVEHVRADAGIDIGDTLIGMHLKEVAVPVRISVTKIGEAHVVCARTRAKFVGGARAVYDEALL